MFNNIDVAPEETVEPAIYTVLFVPAAVGLWGLLEADCTKLRY